jgi:phosphohistidine phosphatase
MRRLMLLRHAKAERAEPGAPDRERGLTPRGREDALKLGAYMAKHALLPDRALVSPAARTQETWKLLAAAFPAVPVTPDPRLYEASAQTIVGLVKETAADIHALIVVGHNPALHEAARLLIASGDVDLRERLHEEMPTAALAVIDFPLDDWRKLHPHSGRLDRLVVPRWLETATD